MTTRTVQMQGDPGSVLAALRGLVPEPVREEPPRGAQRGPSMAFLSAASFRPQADAASTGAIDVKLLAELAARRAAARGEAVHIHEAVSDALQGNGGRFMGLTAPSPSAPAVAVPVAAPVAAAVPVVRPVAAPAAAPAAKKRARPGLSPAQAFVLGVLWSAVILGALLVRMAGAEPAESERAVVSAGAQASERV